MEIIKQSCEFLDMTKDVLRTIEKAGRTCYKSEGMITEGSSIEFVRKLIKRGHEAMIEHAYASYRFITDRGVTHEIVRHRLFSFAQESTRYCNYSGGVTFIRPFWIACNLGEYGKDNLTYFGKDPDQYWFVSMAHAEESYIKLLDLAWTPQQARSVLPNGLKTEIVVTGNFREWRHFFKLRTAKTAHPQMREIAIECFKDFQTRCPVIVEDIEI